MAKAVGPSTPQLIEDACSFAWAKFLQCQPDRNENWKGWLFRTAQREAWRLSARSRETRSLGGYAGEEDRVFEASTRSRPSGVRSSWDTVASSSRWSATWRSMRAAMSLKAVASTSSSPVARGPSCARAVSFPAPSSPVARTSSEMGRARPQAIASPMR